MRARPVNNEPSAKSPSARGRSRTSSPGAASLAHRGILFLDEAPEFVKGVLDALRQPLEHGYVRISRVNGTAEYSYPIIERVRGGYYVDF